MLYEKENLVNKEAYEPILHGEQSGVALLLHILIQQNQIEKVSLIQNAYNPYFYCWIYQGLYISTDISKSSSSLAAARSYYYMTRSIAETLASIFKVSFPDWYNKYSDTKNT